MSNPVDNPLPSVLRGKRLRFCPPQESDRADRLACGHDTKFRKMMGGNPQKDDERVRDHLANERTYLAWLRTGIATMGFGVVIAKLHYLVMEVL